MTKELKKQKTDPALKDVMKQKFLDMIAETENHIKGEIEKQNSVQHDVGILMAQKEKLQKALSDSLAEKKRIQKEAEKAQVFMNLEQIQHKIKDLEEDKKVVESIAETKDEKHCNFNKTKKKKRKSHKKK